MNSEMLDIKRKELEAARVLLDQAVANRNWGEAKALIGICQAKEISVLHLERKLSQG